MKQKTDNTKTDSEEQLLFSSFYLEDTLCGIDIAHVQEINEDFAITRVPLSPDYVMGIMNLRGQIVTVLNLAMKIGLSPSAISPTSRVIIVISKGENIGLLVDKVTDVATILPSDISKSPANIKGAQGVFFQGILHTDTNELMALLNIAVVLDTE
ncbi:MAG: purine-binding chemotaxis protein CheW [Proteobacteria bacterium]|nr:purine-binding chemotaxis protein CheW [Pseudomonadota bacterium]